MIDLVFVAIGIATYQILKSAGVTADMWQFYGIVGCLVITVGATAITIDRRS